MQELNGQLELIAHVRVDANDYRTSKKRTLGKIPRRKREAYWIESLAEAGIHDVRTIVPDQWDVAVRDIHDERMLRNILFAARDRIPKDTDRGEALAQRIEGGLSLFHEDEMIFANTCCSDLSNIKDWEMAAKSKQESWEMLWNGHPWRYVRYEKGNLIFTDYTEKALKFGSAKYTIPAANLKQAVKQARQEIDQFSERLIASYLADKGSK